jgi:hypothetical protein
MSIQATGGIEVSQGTGNYVYVQDQKQNVWMSNDTGDTFTKVYTFGGDANCVSADIHMPHDSGLSDNTLYGMFGSQTNEVYIQKTTDKFSTAPANITPTSGGVNYGGNGATFRKRKVHSCSLYPNNIATLACIKEVSAVTVKLFTSNTSGASWTMRKDFSNCIGGGLIIHPVDPAKMYMMGDAYHGYDSILISSDTGVTWTNKVGNWVAVFAVEPTYRTHWPGDDYDAGLIFPLF